MSEIRSSHFTLGYEPVKTHMVTSNQESKDDVNRKWQVIPTNIVKKNLPAAAQNFNINNGSQVFNGKSSNAIEFPDHNIKTRSSQDMAAVKERVETLRKSSLPFRSSY